MGSGFTSMEIQHQIDHREHMINLVEYRLNQLGSGFTSLEIQHQVDHKPVRNDKNVCCGAAGGNSIYSIWFLSVQESGKQSTPNIQIKKNGYFCQILMFQKLCNVLVYLIRVLEGLNTTSLPCTVLYLIPLKSSWWVLGKQDSDDQGLSRAVRNWLL